MIWSLNFREYIFFLNVALGLSCWPKAIAYVSSSPSSKNDQTCVRALCRRGFELKGCINISHPGRCELCPRGYAKATTDASPCLPCKSGTYSNRLGSAICTECDLSCPSGSVRIGCGAALAGVCETCPSGTAQSSVNDTISCVPCSTGKFAPRSGSVSCLPCEPCPGGQIRVGCIASSPGSCQLCPPGTTKSTDNKDSQCDSCSPGSYQPSPGQTSCLGCDGSMEYVSDDRTKCLKCSQGSYIIARSSCVVCPSGMSCNGTAELSPCGSDKMYSPGGGHKCKLCPPGSSTSGGNKNTRSRCEVCPGGYFSCDGTSRMISCPAGTSAKPGVNMTCTSCGSDNLYSSPGSSICLPGYFTAGGTQETRTSCSTCPAGNECDGTSRFTSCPKGTYAGNGKSCIPCPYGKFSIMKASKCQPCPANTFASSSKGAHQCFSCAVGKFSNEGSIGCTECSGDVTQEIVGQKPIFVCSPSTQKSSSQDGKQAGNEGVIAVIVILVVFVVFLTWYRYSKFSSGYDLVIWNTAEVPGKSQIRQPILKLSGHSKGISSIRFGKPQDRYLEVLSSSLDGTARVWDFWTGTQMAAFRGEKTDPISTAEFLETSRSDMYPAIATISKNGILRRWTYEASTSETVLEEEEITTEYLCKQGEIVVLKYEDSQAIVYNLRSGKKIAALVGHKESILCATVSKESDDSILVCTGSVDCTARLWTIFPDESSVKDHITSHVLWHPHHGHFGEIVCVSFSPDRTFVLTGSTDSQANLWRCDDSGSHKFQMTLGGFKDGTAVTSVAFSPGYTIASGKIALGTSDGTIVIWSCDNDNRLKLKENLNLKGCEQQLVHCLDFSPVGNKQGVDESYLIAGCSSTKNITLLNSSKKSKKALAQQYFKMTNNPLPQRSVTFQHGLASDFIILGHKENDTFCELGIKLKNFMKIIKCTITQSKGSNTYELHTDHHDMNGAALTMKGFESGDGFPLYLELELEGRISLTFTHSRGGEYIRSKCLHLSKIMSDSEKRDGALVIQGKDGTQYLILDADNAVKRSSIKFNSEDENNHSYLSVKAPDGPNHHYIWLGNTAIRRNIVTYVLDEEFEEPEIQVISDNTQQNAPETIVEYIMRKQEILSDSISELAPSVKRSNLLLANSIGPHTKRIPHKLVLKGHTTRHQKSEGISMESKSLTELAPVPMSKKRGINRNRPPSQYISAPSFDDEEEA